MTAPKMLFPRRRPGLWGAGLVIIALLAGCGSPTSEPPSAGAGSSSTPEDSVAGTYDEARATGEDPMPEPPTRQEQPSGSPSRDVPGADQGVDKPVPPPVKTDVRDKVEVREQDVLDAVPTSQSVAVVDEVLVSISSMERVTSEARGPGEIGGPAVSVAISMRNRTSQPVDLTSTTVTAMDASGAPLVPLIRDPASPFEGELSPSDDASGVYIFSLAGAKSPLTITVNLSADTPVAVFTGALSR